MVHGCRGSFKDPKPRRRTARGVIGRAARGLRVCCRGSSTPRTRFRPSLQPLQGAACLVRGKRFRYSRRIRRIDHVAGPARRRCRGYHIEAQAWQSHSMGRPRCLAARLSPRRSRRCGGGRRLAAISHDGTAPVPPERRGLRPRSPPIRLLSRGLSGRAPRARHDRRADPFRCQSLHGAAPPGACRQPLAIAPTRRDSLVRPVLRARKPRQDERAERDSRPQAAAYAAEADQPDLGEGRRLGRRLHRRDPACLDAGARQTAVLALLYGAGLRISEALGIKATRRADRRCRGYHRRRQGLEDAAGADHRAGAARRRALPRALPLSAAAPTGRSSSASGWGRCRRASSSSRSSGCAVRSACPTARRRMRCAIRSRRICSAAAATFVPSRSCSATRRSRRRRSTRRSTRHACSRATGRTTRGRADQVVVSQTTRNATMISATPATRT